MASKVEKVCARQGCQERFAPRTDGGKPKRYCSPRCRTLANVAATRVNPIEDLAEPVPGKPYVPASSGRAGLSRRHPAGWEPGFNFDSASGTGSLTAVSGDRDPRWDGILEQFGFDPKLYEVVEPVQVRSWEALKATGRNADPTEIVTLYYHRASIRTRSGAAARSDVEALSTEIRRHRARTRPPAATGVEQAFVLNLSDWQIGKSDGDGSPGIVARVLAMVDETKGRIAELRRSGRRIDTLYVVGLGDLGESCDGHYPMQAFAADLNMRDQGKIIRRLVTKILTELAPLFSRVVVVAVGGNHGEERRAGKAYTDFADNRDVAVFEQVAEILAANPDAYGHVSFVLPNADLAVVVNIAGTNVAFIHGHQAKRQGAPVDKLTSWWRGQMDGARPAGDASILVAGHFHYFAVSQRGPRTIFIAPTLEGGSDWYVEGAGAKSPAGTLTFTVGPDGWDDVFIIPGRKLEEAQAA